MPLRPATSFGSYEIVGPLGVGGMGEVYRARDSKLGRDIALKVLPAESLKDDIARARLSAGPGTSSNGSGAPIS